MRIRLPRLGGLRARLILLLFGALLIAQAATFALFLDERGRAIRLRTAEAAAARALAFAEDLDRAGPHARDALVERVHSRVIRVWIAPEPAVDRRAATPLSGIAESALAVSGTPSRPLRLAIDGRDGDGPGRPRWRHREALLVAAGLGDGAWLNARVRLRPAPLRWAPPLLVSVGLAGLAVGAIVWVFVGRLLRPMEALAHAADRLGGGERPEPLPLSGPTEARRLADAFNRMAERLTRLLDERARTLAAIGHDLRSPVTAMRLRVEMVDDPETRERLGVCLDEIETLTEAALALARGAGAEEARERVDLGALLASLVAELTEAGATASLDAPAGVVLDARPVALRRALRNLGENAVRYGAAARISLGRDGAVARITVDDNGPGIPERERERVFEPFVRLETSRSRDTGGTGLGLSIARAVVEGHGGTIGLGDAPGGGTRVTVTLPLS